MSRCIRGCTKLSRVPQQRKSEATGYLTCGNVADLQVAGKWAASSWAKGIARKAAKAGMGDFDRFTMMVARKTRARAVNKAMKSMKKK